MVPAEVISEPLAEGLRAEAGERSGLGPGGNARPALVLRPV